MNKKNNNKNNNIDSNKPFFFVINSLLSMLQFRKNEKCSDSSESFCIKYESNNRDKNKMPDLDKVKTPIFLNKEETMNQVLEELWSYLRLYKRIAFDIRDYQWELLFDAAYELFEYENKVMRFYPAMSRLVLVTFINALLSEHYSISIFDFVRNLYCLNEENINYKKILILQQKIISRLKKEKVVSINDLKEIKKNTLQGL